MSSRRRAIDIEGVKHGAPIPMGCRIDNIVYSSGIMGTDPATGETPEDGEAQVRFAFANMEKFLEAAEVTPDDVIRMTVLLADMSIREFVNEEWLRLFPNPEDRPARHAVQQNLNGKFTKIQLEVIAVAAT
jgi:2-iminobutanoate/2-iminopropanoate deaminase